MERLRGLEIPKGNWVVFCQTCQKSIYSPEKDNLITRTIGMQAAIEHKYAYTAPHVVFIVDFAKNKVVGD